MFGATLMVGISTSTRKRNFQNLNGGVFISLESLCTGLQRHKLLVHENLPS